MDNNQSTGGAIGGTHFLGCQCAQCQPRGLGQTLALRPRCECHDCTQARASERQLFGLGSTR